MSPGRLRAWPASRRVPIVNWSVHDGAGSPGRWPTRAVFAATQDWTQAHKIFPDLPPSLLGYDEAALA